MRAGESFENRFQHFFLYRNSSVLVIEFRASSIQKVGSMKGNEVFSSRNCRLNVEIIIIQNVLNQTIKLHKYRKDTTRILYIYILYELLDVVSILFNATRRGEFVKEEKSFSIISFYIEILLIENEFDSKCRIDEGK